jgi:hypothetical protein
MWEPRPLTTLWASTACYKDNFTFFSKVKGKVKLSLHYAMKTSEEVEAQVHNFLPRHSMEVKGQFQAPAALYVWKEPPVPIG